jgi:ferredoxin
MKGITQHNHDKHRYLNALFKSVIDNEKCVRCEICIERCLVKAIKMKEFPTVEYEKWLGCGCVQLLVLKML